MRLPRVRFTLRRLIFAWTAVGLITMLVIAAGPSGDVAAAFVAPYLALPILALCLWGAIRPPEPK